MPVKYAKQISSKVTPQSEAIPDSGQVANSAGGFSFEITPLQKLDRFLILGNEGGSYYAEERAMTKKNAAAVLGLIKTDGVKVVQRVLEISDSGRAPKNDPALFVLALAAKFGDLETRKAAYASLNKVARIGTHLFSFADSIEEFGGWGRATKRAVQNWYLEKETDQLAYQVVKYQQRNGRSHRDMLRLSHLYVGDADVEKAGLVEYIRKGNTEKPTPRILQGASLIQVPDLDIKNIVRLIQDYKLPREAIPTQYLTKPEVWEVLLQDMPMTAMIRNLATMTRIGLLTGNSEHTQKVIAQLSDTERLKKARVHPIQILIAQKTYASGHSLRGTTSWSPVSQIIDALDDAFYASFQFVTPSNKRHLLALDVSGSMTGGAVAGIPDFTPRDASAAMALVTAKTEPRYEVVGFTGGGRGYFYGGRGQNADELTKLSISPKQRLTDAIKTVSGLPFGGTDCALPMIYASKHKLEIDAFVIYTDSETWAGTIHPVQALKQYREQTGIPAKLIVVGMVANDFSIADPRDAGMLDVVGFDTNAPVVIGDFVRDQV